MQHALESIKTGLVKETIQPNVCAIQAILISVRLRFVILSVVTDFYMETKFVMIKIKDLVFQLVKDLLKGSNVSAETIHLHLFVHQYVEMELLLGLINAMMVLVEDVCQTVQDLQ